MSRFPFFLIFIALGLIGAGPEQAASKSKPTPVSTSTYPEGKLGEMVKLGEAIVHETKDHPLSKAYVGNALNCTSCHLDDGKHPSAATFLGLATAYPAYSPREGRVITLEDRILNCFMRSCNGVRPPLGSEVSIAVTTYITWLSQGQGLWMNPKAPLGPNHVPRLIPDPARADPEEGRLLFEQFCSSCHGSKGGGTKKGPAVWGPRSYNAGAGLATLNGLTSWLAVSMPLDDASLTADEARDIAAYILTKPRPRFVLRDHLPPPEGLGVYNSEVLDEVKQIKARVTPETK